MATNDSLSRLTFDQLIGLGYQSIDNALNAPEILAALAPAYTAASLTAKRAELEALEDAGRLQQAGYGTQYGATGDTDKAWHLFHTDTYMPHVELARAAFRKDLSALTRLGLDGERAEDFYGWAGQVNQFYRTLTAEPPLAARLALLGVTPAELGAAQSAFEALREQERGQEGTKGLAQQGTRDRKALAGPFREWLGVYRDTARVKLRAHPDWLERLGFLARSDDE